MEDDHEDCMISFHTRTLKAISRYLKNALDCTPRSALQSFACSEHCRHDPSTASSQTVYTDDGCSQESANRRRLASELRITVLMCLGHAGKGNRAVLRRYHLYAHLMELGLDRLKSMHQKLREFLNTNFAPYPNDIVGHACRGNYEEIARHSPVLAPAFGEYGSMGRTREALGAWQKKFGVPNSIAVVLSGHYRGIENRLEEHCYKLLHGVESGYSDEYTRILQGDFGPLEQDQRGWVRLAALMTTSRNAPLREYESCFEHLFHETFDLDFQIGLEYLSYSRKCVFYFDVLADRIPLDGMSVEALLGFAHRNGLNPTGLVKRYGRVLQELGEYELLCSLVLRYSIGDFGYTKDTMQYFIRNLPRLRPLAAEHFTTHSTGLFIAGMSNMESLEEERMGTVLESEYFGWFYDEITESMLKRDDVSDEVMLSLVGKLLETESKTGTSTKDAKARVMQKLIG